MTEKQLGQLRPTNTNTTSVYSPSGVTGIIKTIIVCNVGSGTIKYSIYLDDDGTTYTEATAISFDVSLTTENTTFIQTYIPLSASGNIAFKTDTANDATITILGAEI